MKLQNHKLIINISNAKTFLFASLPALFYLANLFRMTNHSGLPYLLCIYIVGGIGILKLLLSKSHNPMFLITAVIYIVTKLFNVLLIGNVDISDIVADIFFFGITYIMLVYPLAYIQGVVLSYITFIVFIVSYQSGVNTHFLLSSSGNYISVLLIMSAAIYYIALQQSQRKMRIWDLIPALLCFLLSIWAKGRGGILSTGVFLALLLLIFFLNIRNKPVKYILVFLLVSIIILAIITSYSDNLLNWFFSLGKWGYRGTDNSARMYIWSDYISKVFEDFSFFFFGAPLKDIPAVAVHGGNCHNSFIQLHAYNGIIMFVYFVYLLLHSVKYYISNKQWILLTTLFVFCLRAFTDKFIFGQYGMPIMMFLVLWPYFDNPVKNRITQTDHNVLNYG